MQTQTNQPTNGMTRVVAAVLDTHNLVLYKPDGSTIKIPQGDPRLRRVLDQATPGLMRDNFADVDLAEEADQTFREFEEQSGGVVKFFRVAKSKLANFFKRGPVQHEEPVQLGVVPEPNTFRHDTQNEPTASQKEQDMAQAVDEILKHAVPASSADFTGGDVASQVGVTEESGDTPGAHTSEDHSDTIIAVVNNQVVPGVEKITSQFQRAVNNGSTKGMENLIRRMAAVASDRKHSTDDLIKFLERGDLPVADDGSIIIYKVLRKKDNKGLYVDCHTGNVPQKVGSFVCMDASMVDPNRRNECSNGLHVARRGYISGFSGDVCVLAKLAPEDVIAVPEYDANKMRVCGYHIIAELPEAMYANLRGNRPITNTQEGRELLAKAIAGQHVGRLEEVRITQAKGGGIEVTPLVAAKDKPVEEVQAPIQAKLVAKAVALENVEVVKDEPVAVKDVLNNVNNLSRKDTAQGLYETYKQASDADEKATALQALRDYKKLTKTGWDKLGITDPKVTQGTQAAAPTAPTKPTKAATKAIAQAKGKGKHPTKASKPSKDTKVTEAAKPKTPREEIQNLLPKFQAATGSVKADLAHDMLRVKKAAKKSWDILGVPSAVVDQINLRTK